jgi:hypothetical protein
MWWIKCRQMKTVQKSSQDDKCFRNALRLYVTCWKEILLFNTYSITWYYYMSMRVRAHMHTQIYHCAIRARMWHVQDGARAHFSHVVPNILNKTFHDLIGRGRPTAWPPRSPYLNALDFYHLWGTPINLCVCISCWQRRVHTIAFWMPVRLTATTPASLNGCRDRRRSVHWITWRTFRALIMNTLFQV